jgi:hypothetical protein
VIDFDAAGIDTQAQLPDPIPAPGYYALHARLNAGQRSVTVLPADEGVNDLASPALRMTAACARAEPIVCAAAGRAQTRLRRVAASQQNGGHAGADRNPMRVLTQPLVRDGSASARYRLQA